LLIAALGLGATAAEAHPRLQMSNPAPGAKLNAAPKDIRMRFSEGLVVNFTGLELKNGNGKLIPTGKTMLDSGDNMKIVVPIGTRLTAGTYNVAWHAVSTDTHRVSGSYRFQVLH
jgi:methionine-rich copper-binding protein CopC